MTAYQLFDPLPAHIEDALRASIERFGVLVPVTVDQDGNVLDGHHRKRIAEELRTPYDRLIRHCADDDERREIAHTLNADRRQLTEDQRRDVAAELRRQGHSYRAIGGALGVDEKTIRNDLSTADHSAVQPERVKGLDGKSRPARRPQVIARDDREQERGQAALATVPDVNANRTLDVKRLERIAREHEAERRRAQPTEPTSTHSSIEIRHGDFRDVLDDLAGTVDAIITDPPYPKEFVPVFSDLSTVAAHILKPTGILVVLTGTIYLPEYIRALDTAMTYRWTGAYVTQGPRSRVYASRVGQGWKPVLIYNRQDAPRDDVPWILDDLFDSQGDDKRFHHWGQSESGFSVLVERMTEPGQLVVDPFLGGGTTAVVCRDLGRRFVGCDIDAAAIHASRERAG